MLRNNLASFQQRPKKMFSLNVLEVEDYNEFKGQAMEEDHQNTVSHLPEQSECSINHELKKYQQIYQNVMKEPRRHRKLNDKKEEKGVRQQVKVKEQTVKKETDEPKVKLEANLPKTKPISKNKPEPKAISSNWKQFLSEQKPTKKDKQAKYQFVAIDCQFVKSNQTECLARVSLVNEHGEVLYDSYVKPELKITDYLTEVSGITFKHIKNAPNQEQALSQVKKKMMNKIIVGHTVHKDLGVCGLSNWKGCKEVVDIAECKCYSPGGKRISLKNLSYAHLGKTIQEGWHSSVEDAQSTMQLFVKNKGEILKERKIIKK